MKHVQVWMRLGAMVATVLFGMPNVFADVSAQGGQIIGASSAPIKMVAVTSDSNAVSALPAGTALLGIKLVATTGVGQCTLYDASTIAAGSNSTVIDEISEATTGESNVQMWPMPYRVATAVSVDVTTAACIIYYQ